MHILNVQFLVKFEFMSYKKGSNNASPAPAYSIQSLHNTFIQHIMNSANKLILNQIIQINVDTAVVHCCQNSI